MAGPPEQTSHNGITIFVKSKDDDDSGEEERRRTKTDAAAAADEDRKVNTSVEPRDKRHKTNARPVVTQHENAPRLQQQRENKEVEERSQRNTPSEPSGGQRSNATFSDDRPKVHSPPQPNRGSNAPDYVHSVLLETKDKKFKPHRRHSLWYRLLFRHVHMGVVEVCDDHPYYLRLQAISAGLRNLQSGWEQKSGNLTKEHYREVTEQHFTLEGRNKRKHTCVFESYAPAVFATIRRAIAVDDHLYTQSLTTRDHPFLEYISNSGGGQDFLLSSDTQYIIKTNNKEEVKVLLSILEKCVQHFLSHPQSLLVKYLGCYAVQFTGKKKTYFLVMQNVFYSPDRMDDRFDVKGCTARRYQEPDAPGAHTTTVLKDQNFIQENLQLGANREWFIDQITADATFLNSLGLMDYSLLIGRQKIHRAEQKPAVPKLDSHLNKSQPLPDSRAVSADGSTASDKFQTSAPSPALHNQNAASQLSGAAPPEDLPQPHPHSHSRAHDHPSPRTGLENGRTPLRKNGLRLPHSPAEDEQKLSNGSGCCLLDGRGRRGARILLPGCPNALHVVDGDEYRYFFGIVDILTQWTLREKLIRLLKCCFGEHSTMPPEYYSRRFVAFLTERTV